MQTINRAIGTGLAVSKASVNHCDQPTRNSAIECMACVLFCFVTALIGAGCSRSERETAPVHGIVTLDGVPLSKGTVMFVPDSGRAGRGVIQPDGSFRLSCYAKDDGAMVGLNRVSIIVPQGENATAEDIKRHRIPVRYTTPDSSGLSFEIGAGRDNEVDLKLTTKP